MDPESLIRHARELYLDEFIDFVERQNLASVQGAAEVKLRLSNRSEVYQRLYCADFVNNDGQPQVLELRPVRALQFPLIEGSYGEAVLVIEQMRWDSVVVRHDAPEPLDALAGWFERWFDPEDMRHVDGAVLGNVIHSLVVEPGTLSIDFGSSETDAFWEVVDLLVAAGATTLHIVGSDVDGRES